MRIAILAQSRTLNRPWCWSADVQPWTQESPLVLGLPHVLRRLVLVMLFSYKIQLSDNVAAPAAPSMGGATAAIIGPRGRIFVSIDLQISTRGSYLSSMRGLNCHDT
jgi:hypothetical protein